MPKFRVYVEFSVDVEATDEEEAFVKADELVNQCAVRMVDNGFKYRAEAADIEELKEEP